MTKRTILMLAAGLAAPLAGCYDPEAHVATVPPDQMVYQGGEWDTPREVYAGELTGPGVALLDPWLRETREGRAVVTLGFGEAASGFVSEDVAHRVNIWFRRYADQNCDMVITDPEIRTALVTATQRYLR